MFQTLVLVAVALLGACVGSFLNVVIYRVPARSFLSGGKRSHCPKCGVQIKWIDNIPIVSWLFLRGKGRCCGNPISPRYPFVEALTAGVLLWVFYVTVGHRLPQTLEPGWISPGWEHWGKFVFHAWFLSILIACTFIDFDHRILPDVLTKPTMVVGVVGAVLVPGFVGEGFAKQGVPDAFERAAYSVVGLVCGLALTQGIRVGASKVFRREAMGFGDVKFMGAIGVFVGWDGTLSTFFIGSMLGALYGGLHQLITKEGQIFFGPFLAVGAVITLFFKRDIVTFVTQTWPNWQAANAGSPWVMGGIALVAAALLFFIIRRGRR
jgi:leader peptidase (prepilin peptidase)/N-methyltransferase